MKKTVPKSFYTLEELKEHIIEKLNSENTHAGTITRIHEYMFGTIIPHCEGYDAPEGKYLVKVYDSKRFDLSVR